MTKSAWQTIGLAVLSVVVLAGAVWVVVKPYRGEPWHPPQTSVASVERPEAAFVGDDYVEGAGATTPARRWSTLVADQEGLKELNFGQSGTGYVNPGEQVGESPLSRRVDAVIASRPDVVVVSAGMNDVEDRYTRREIRSAVNRAFRRLRAGLPDARIVAVAPLYPDSNPPRKVALIARFVRSAARRVDAEFVQTGPWLDDLALRLADDEHLNDAGYRMLATRTGRELFGPEVVPARPKPSLPNLTRPTRGASPGR